MSFALTTVSEAGGLFLTEFGTEDVALASAGWAARAQDASTLYKNPAGMSRLEGNQFQGGLQALTTSKAAGSAAPTPHMAGMAEEIRSVCCQARVASMCTASARISKSGLGMLGNFGLALKNDQGFLGRYYVKQATLVGITFAPVASYQVNE